MMPQRHVVVIAQAGIQGHLFGDKHPSLMKFKFADASRFVSVEVAFMVVNENAQLIFMSNIF